jgi:hypothetical protein
MVSISERLVEVADRALPGATERRFDLRQKNSDGCQILCKQRYLDYDVEIRKIICSTNANPVVERSLPGRLSPRRLAQRASRVEVSLAHQVIGPHRQPWAACGGAEGSSGRLNWPAR